MIIFIYLLPLSCALFMVNLVSIMKKIHQGDMDTGLNTFLAIISLTLMLYPLTF